MFVGSEELPPLANGIRCSYSSPPRSGHRWPSLAVKVHWPPSRCATKRFVAGDVTGVLHSLCALWGDFLQPLLRNIASFDEMIEGLFENRLQIAVWMLVLQQIPCPLKFTAEAAGCGESDPKGYRFLTMRRLRSQRNRSRPIAHR